MISKVITGKTFYGCCRYVCKDEKRAEILCSEGVRDYDYRLMALDFEINRQALPNKGKAVFHGILSFHPSDRISNRLMLHIAGDYLKRLCIENTQFVIVRHSDKAHLHLHIIANLVNNNGKAITDSWLGLRGKKAAQAITEEYKLVPAIRKDMALTNLRSLNEEEAARYEIFRAIRTALSQCNTLQELEAVLLRQHIDIQYKYRRGTTEPQGISFRKGKFAFKGSSIDRAYSLGGLQKVFSHGWRKHQRIMQPIQRQRGLRR